MYGLGGTGKGRGKRDGKGEGRGMGSRGAGGRGGRGGQGLAESQPELPSEDAFRPAASRQ